MIQIERVLSCLTLLILPLTSKNCDLKLFDVFGFLNLCGSYLKFKMCLTFYCILFLNLKCLHG